MAQVHPTAIVDAGARLDDDVVIGPYSVVGPGAQLARGVTLHAHVVVQGRTELAAGVEVYPFAVLGTPPQVRPPIARSTSVRVGPRTVLREYVTIQPGVQSDGSTVVGADCLIMAHCHVAHDCRIGDRVVMANLTQLAGHCEVGDDTVLGGLTNVHQFVRIGRRALTGAASRVVQDVPPFCLVDGHPARLVGLNRVGLRRGGLPIERMGPLARAVAAAFPKDGRVLRRPCLRTITPEVQELLTFMNGSRRGLTSRRRKLRCGCS
jgi:UDP-N-acetylglucosamine acyltransferase